MNTIRLLITSAVLGLAAVSPVVASTSLVSPSITEAPKPLYVVHPSDLMPQYRNTTVSVELTIDRNGNVHNVVPVGEMSKELANRLIPAVQQWTFTPARNAKGETVQKTVILPITLS